MARRLVVVGAAALAVLGLVAGPAEASPQPPAPTVTWGVCDPDSGGGQAGGFQCATVPVPLDWARPQGPSITLSLVRRPATGPGPRIGSLFLNPGGPGGSGTGQIPGWISLLPKGLNERFDIVSWDPRGVAESNPPQCFDNLGQELAFLGDAQYFPVGAAAQRAYIATYREFGQRCARRDTQHLLAHVSTADTARDLDHLRQAVGDAKLSYLGLSYGTFLGATYAAMFPDKVRALVLDGNVAPSSWTGIGRPGATSGTGGRIGSGPAAAQVYDDLLTLCGRTDTVHCPFSAGSPAATHAKFATLLDRLRRGPISLSGVPITYEQLLSQASDGLDIVQPFTSPVAGNSASGWSGLGTAMERLWRLRDTPIPPPVTPEPPPAGVAPYPGAESSTAIQCGDSPVAPTALFPALAAQAERRDGPIALGALWTDEICSTWPAKAAASFRGPFDGSRTPLLVLNTTSDPATPISNARRMVNELDNGSRLLTVRGYGHTVFLNPSTCAARAEVAYLTGLTLPRPGTVCAQDAAPFATVAVPA
ncbi:alpha/beta hydrolase [Pseudonocardia alni]|uniref:alpha/beta hydrolase n=1 Tax=Pseudonocardia alni TaxID=33907 RepID=UPI00331AD94D